MVVGHYGCGGVRAALQRRRASAWPTTGCATCRTCMSSTPPCVDSACRRDTRHDRLCELNVLEQVLNVRQTTVVQDAWRRGQPLTVHGWIYGLSDGLMRDLGLTVDRDAS
ncbi:MAG: hypothetical protein MZW92_05035 [Comamonadaceae bacterium]|nr:hypothetical protein [Comamonadaceae bacterium]